MVHDLWNASTINIRVKIYMPHATIEFYNAFQDILGLPKNKYT